MNLMRGVVVMAVVCAVLSTMVTSAAARGAAGVPLRDAVAALVLADEVRDGYDRSLFRHWIDADGDGCSTRAEVLLDEAVQAPLVGSRCSVGDGSWYSYYDDVYVQVARGLDIDHMVPLAEAWDSGASGWTPQRRQAYANDLDEPRALVAVTAAANRSKADQDPGQWLPPLAGSHCHYLLDWVTVKTRWGLTVDVTEQRTLAALAETCPNEPVFATAVS